MSTVLLAMNNPLSSNPAHALFPHPPGSSGHRLWRMLHAVTGLGRGTYLHLDRRNVLGQPKWSRALAVQRGDQLRVQLAGEYRTVLVFGAQTWAALGLPPTDWVLPVHLYATAWRKLPHPSGRTRWYNCAAHRLIVGLLLEEAVYG